MVPPERPVPPSLSLDIQEDFLKKEKEMVGIYLSSHPLDTFRFEMKHFTSHTIEEVHEILEESRAVENFTAREVRIGGMVTQVTSAIARSTGRPWGTFTLEDYTSSFMFTLFGKEYEQFIPYMNMKCFLCVVAFRNGTEKETVRLKIKKLE